MSLLEQYEQQYAGLIADITIQIGQLRQCNELKELCGKIDNGLLEAQELLEQMGLEIRDINITQRSMATNKLNCAQVELKRLQQEYKQTKEEIVKKRINKTSGSATVTTTTTTINEIINQHVNNSGATGDYEDYFEDVSISNDQRARLLDNSELIERTGNRLQEGYRVILETETLGAQVLNDLHHQRETIQTSRSRLRETNAELGRASRTLNSMLFRAMRQKIILYTVAACFVLAVIVSVYFTFTSNTRSSNS